ncbi:MAG: sulfatase-like hydrolase/transferase [Hyphomicrobiaceae bacterium]
MSRTPSTTSTGAAPKQRAQPAARAALPPRYAIAITAVAVVAITWRLRVAEGDIRTNLYAGLICAAFGAVAVLLTRRLLVGTVAASALVVLVSTAAHFKRESINLVLHAYDLVFYLPQWTTIAFLWNSYPALVAGALGALIATTTAIVLAYRLDATRIPRTAAATAAVAFALGSAAAAQGMGERRHLQMGWPDLYLTSFFQSWPETIETLWRGQLMEAAAASDGPAFRIPRSCEPAERPPHIILIHHESLVQPSLFPTLSYDRRLDSFFQSDDGAGHQLRVETYGGASTMTEFSVLTGLSTRAFGGMRQFVQWLMAGKVRDSLPHALADCGYRNVLFYPMLKSFVFAEKFFDGVGIPEIMDLKAQKARRVDERDRFYYANLLDELARHVESRAHQPMFTLVETMAAHGPYHFAYAPEAAVPGGGPDTHPEINEYLRRLWLAKIDYDYLVGELARRFPSERFLIVRYGDHQPVATRFLLGWGKTAEAEDILLQPDSKGFTTFFAINGVNFQPAQQALPGTLDVPYLGTVVLRAAALPLSDSYRSRERLITACGGRFSDCPDRDRILAFQRRLIDSGLVLAR